MGRKNSCWYGYYYKVKRQEKVTHSVIKKSIHWEMNQSILIAPKMSLHQNNVSVFLLGIIIFLYFIKIKGLKWQKNKFEKLHSASRKIFICSYVLKSKVRFFYLKYKSTQNSNKFVYNVSDCIFPSQLIFFKKRVNFDENSVIIVKVLLLVLLPHLLIVAGDVELNPGPYKPELLTNLMKDFHQVASNSSSFGIQLGINLDKITSIQVQNNYDMETVLAKIFHYWLNNTPEDNQFSILSKALAFIGRNDLVNILKSKYSPVPFEVISVTNSSVLCAPSHASQISNFPESCTKACQTSEYNITQSSHDEKLTANFECSNESAASHSDDMVNFPMAELTESLKDEDILYKNRKYTLYYRALDSDDMKDKSELEKDTNKMIYCFTKILDGLFKFLKKNTEHAIDSLKYILEGWVSYGPIQKNDQYQNISPDKVEDIEDFQKLWRIFSRFCSFFNFRLLERIINVVDYVAGVQEIEEYKRVFAEYLERRVTQCPSGIGMQGDDHVVLLVKLDDAYAKCCMKHLKTLGEDICEIIHAQKEKMHIEGVGTGSICVILHIHKSALQRGFFFLSDLQINALKQLRYMEARILSTECGGERYFINCTKERDAGDPQSQWKLTGVADSTQQGTSERIREKINKLSQLTHENERRAQEARMGKEEAERRAQQAEMRSQEAERRAQAVQEEKLEIEQRAQDLERRLAEMEEIEQRARDLEKKLAEMEEIEQRAQDLERRLAEMNEIRQRAQDLERRLAEMEIEERNPEEVKKHWLVERREIHMTSRKLGGGGWGEVKVAEFRGEQVAAKIPYKDMQSPYYHGIFEREMNMASRVRSPHLVQFIGASMDEEMVILMELMPTSLRQHLISNTPTIPSAAFRVSVSLDVAKALNYLHLMKPHPIIHRDISSANVLLEPLPNQTWRAKVTDYGSVNLQNQLQTENPGSPVYSAPEARIPSRQSTKMDIFSYGVLLMEMSTAQFPDVDKWAAMIRSIQEKQWVDLILQCLQQDPSQRPSASQLITQFTAMQ